MATPILVMGPPGTGKTASIRNLNPAETFIIHADEKPLGLPGSKANYKTVYKNDGKLDITKSNYFETTNPAHVLELLKAISAQAPHIKTIIIDTITSVMTNEFMSRLKEKGFDKFGDFAKDTYDIIKLVRQLREDLTVVIMAHIEDNYDAEGELRTSFKVIGGKLIKEKVVPESFFHMVLYTDVVFKDGKPEYYFLTQNNGKNTCRSPLGLFTEHRIPNDLKAVIEKYKEYEK
jgi:hypothetical protein